MRHKRATRYVLFLAFMVLGLAVSTNFPRDVYGATSYLLTPLPRFSQEGAVVDLVLSVTGALPSTSYQFVFYVRDPSGKNWTSPLQTHNTTVTESSFFVALSFPSPSFPGTNALCCTYTARVDQIKPLPIMNAASPATFYILLTDKLQYQRTETVSIHATGYNAYETITATIRTKTTQTLVFSQTASASSAGVFATSWKIPRNATIDDYLLTLTGTTTVKSAPDLQGFALNPAPMSISSLNSAKSTYQRTQTMTFSFSAQYPDGTFATTGIALLTLKGASGRNVTLTATYDNISQTFAASYDTFLNNQTGTWTASLAADAYSDSYGNTGPNSKLTSTTQLVPATLAINVFGATYVPIGQQVKFNATITYPDGTALTSTSGTVSAYFLYSGSPIQNDTVPVIFDTGLQLWVGSYTPQPLDRGGLWSLTIKASDSQTPPNAGSATRAITLQDKPPLVSIGLSTPSANSGQSVTVTITASDPDGTISSVKVDWGDGTVDTLPGTATSDSHSYASTGGAGTKMYIVNVTATDNGGQTASSTSNITVSSTGTPGGILSLPLYLFGILAAIIAAMLAGGFLVFRRHRVTHARLKIDLEAVKSEAGRIEHQEFFQSVKDQLRKDKDD